MSVVKVIKLNGPFKFGQLDVTSVSRE